MRMSNPEAMNKSSDSLHRYIVLTIQPFNDSTVQRKKPFVILGR